jgi:IS30 family transposase
MGTNFHHLTLVEREKILEMHCDGWSLRQMAEALGRNPSTLSRELRRNASPAYRCYLPHRAQARAERRKGEASQRFRLKEERIRSYVEAKLHEGWSPEIIAGRIGLDHPGLTISHEAIYAPVYHPQTPNRKDLILCLRRAHRRRKPKGLSRKERKTKIPNRIGIEMRPASVDSRREFGHWEGDTLISRRSPACLASLVERKSRLLRLTKLLRKGASETAQAFIQRLASLPPKARQTLTLDNGTENASHEAITLALGLPCFFCHPYTSWERGSIENIQGLIRWYLPKGTDFGMITDQQVAWIESQLNHRPRKCLGFKTPLEVASPSVAFPG